MAKIDYNGEGKKQSLTTKQRQVLDLLVDYKTSKEIGLILGISPHTVDQRIEVSKKKLGVETRGDAAVAYRELNSLYERMTYEDSYIESSAPSIDSQSAKSTGRVYSLLQRNRINADNVEENDSQYRVVPEVFDGEYGTLVRITAVAILAVLAIFMVLGGLAIFGEISEMLAP